MQPGTHEKGIPLALLSEEERRFRASLEGLVDFYRVSQGAALWNAFWPGAFLFLPAGSCLMAVGLSDRLSSGSPQLFLLVLGMLVTAAAPLWAIVSLLRSIRRDDRYVAIFLNELRVCLDTNQAVQRIAWEDLLDAQCDGEQLVLDTTRGSLNIHARFGELSLAQLASRIRDARRLALWGRLTRPALARTF